MFQPLPEAAKSSNKGPSKAGGENRSGLNSPLPGAEGEEGAEDEPALRRPRLQTLQAEMDTLRGKHKAERGAPKQQKGQGPAQKGEDKHTLRAMAKMLLILMQTTRDLTAAVFDTYLGKVTTPLIKASSKAGKTYSESIKQWKDNHDKSEPHPFGAPHLQVWLELQKTILTEPTTPEAAKVVMNKHKAKYLDALGAPKEGIELVIVGCRSLKTYNKDTKKLLIAIRDEELREAFCLSAKALQLQHRIGRAPTHALEKAMQKVLDNDKEESSCDESMR